MPRVFRAFCLKKRKFAFGDSLLTNDASLSL